MRVSYRGSFTLRRPPEEVFEFLTDPKRFSRSFPGFQSVEVDEEGFTVRVRLSLGPLRGDARVRGRIVEAERPRRAVIKGSGSGAGSTLDFTLEFTVESSGDGGSRVDWSFEGDVGGIAASMGGRVLDPMARRLISQIVENLKREIEK